MSNPMDLKPLLNVLDGNRTYAEKHVLPFIKKIQNKTKFKKFKNSKQNEEKREFV